MDSFSVPNLELPARVSNRRRRFAARFARHAPGDRWFVDETYVKVTGVWRYVYRAVDQHRQVIDVVSARQDAATASRFASVRHVKRHANNPIEADHSQLKHRLRPARGLRTDRTAQVIIAGHAVIQNLRGGHYELAARVVGVPSRARLAA
jgi:transposase-like protein